MIFNKANYQDIVKYYSGTIIKVKETEDRLWKIVDINSKEVMLEDCDGFNAYLDLSENYEVDYPIPGRVVYQNGEHAWMIYRKPAKQYFRGIHPNNTGLLFLDKEGTWWNADISLKRLQEFVDKPCYTPLSKVDGAKQSYALSSVFSISLSRQLFCLNRKIGEFIPASKSIYLYSPLFATEVSNLLEKDWTLQ